MGSIEKVVINLGETCKETRKKTKFTPFSPIKATPDDVTSDEDYLRMTSDDKDYLSMTSVSDSDDVMMTSSAQNESNKVNHSTLLKGDPPEGKTTAVVAVMRGNSKHGCPRR